MKQNITFLNQKIMLHSVKFHNYYQYVFAFDFCIKHNVIKIITI